MSLRDRIVEWKDILVQALFRAGERRDMGTDRRDASMHVQPEKLASQDVDWMQTYDKAREALRQGDRGTAQRLLEQVLRVCPDNWMAQRDLEALQMDAPKAYDKLLHAEIFSGSAVSVDGHMPLTYRALLILLQTPKADEAFRSLLTEATLVGQLYALCGLYCTDYEAFKEAVEPYRRRDERVRIMFGCILDEQKASALVESVILGGGYAAELEEHIRRREDRPGRRSFSSSLR